MSGSINIEGIDPVDLLAALYEGAANQGRQYADRPQIQALYRASLATIIDRARIQSALLEAEKNARGNRGWMYFDYVDWGTQRGNSVALKISMNARLVDIRTYDDYHGIGAGQRAVTQCRANQMSLIAGTEPSEDARPPEDGADSLKCRPKFC